MQAETIPYCGAAPVPGAIAWSLDPLLVAGLLAGLAWAWRRAVDRPALAAGVGALAVVLLSPICAIAVALFSVRVAQHLVILLVAAPLLAVALPTRAPPVGIAAAVFAAILWLWHLPGPYGWTFSSHAAWWVMHASLLLAAVWLAQALLRSRAEAAVATGLATAAQMGGLGAFLTFAPRPLFAPHAFTTLPWGLTALEDQQLGGLLMWVPGGVLFAVLGVTVLIRALRSA